MPAPFKRFDARRRGRIRGGSVNSGRVSGLYGKKGSQSFLSPNRKIWCLLKNEPGDRAANCFFAADRATGGQEYSATLQPNGQLVRCAWQPSQPGVQACDQNWDSKAPVLKSGKVDLIYQYRCRATTTAITCTVNTGAAKGKGFTISGTGVTPIP